MRPSFLEPPLHTSTALGTCTLLPVLMIQQLNKHIYEVALTGGGAEAEKE